MEEPSPRAPIGRVALAVLLSGSILAMTYVLFDEDLGTSAPLFGELTCRGALELNVTNGFGGADLQVPESALRLRAMHDGELRPVLVRIHTREDGGEWRLFHESEAPTGEGAWFVSPTTLRSEVRLDVVDTEGKGCDASIVVRPDPDAAPIVLPTPARPATPATPSGPACADTLRVALASGSGAATLSAPQDVLRATIEGDLDGLEVVASRSRANGTFEAFSRLTTTDGDEAWLVDELDAATIVRVDVLDPTGQRCAARAEIRVTPS